MDNGTKDKETNNTLDFLKATAKMYAFEVASKAVKALEKRHLKKIRTKLLTKLQEEDDFEAFKKRLQRYSDRHYSIILSGTHFPTHNDYSGTSFDRASLNCCNFNETTLTKATFNGCKLRNTSFAGADCRQGSFNWVKAAGVNFEGTNCQNTQFLHADLINSNFKGAQLTGALFESADLTNADFRNADLTCVNFYNAKMDSVDLRGAKLSAHELARIYHNNSNIKLTTMQMLKISLVEYNKHALITDRNTGQRIRVDLISHKPPLFSLGSISQYVREEDLTPEELISTYPSNPSALQMGFS